MNPAEPATRPLSTRESGQKFRVHGLFRLPDMASLPGAASVTDLGLAEIETSYYDTPDLRLAREGITLRLRVTHDPAGGTTLGDEGWLLELPPGRDSALPRELRVPLGTPPGRPPTALADLLRVIVRTAPLDVVARLRTSRRRQAVRGEEGDAVELVDDSVHVVEPDGDVTARFRELKLDVLESGPLIGQVTTALTTAGAVGGEFIAKAVRALGPNAVAPPEVPEPAGNQELLPDLPAHDTLTAYFRKHVRALRAADLAFRRDPGDPEAVHRLRVSARRLRSGLRTFRPLLDHVFAQELRLELAWFARSLGELRESDVLRERLGRHCALLPAEAPRDEVRALLTRELDARVATARARVATVMASGRYVALHDTLVLAARQPPTGPTAGESARLALPPLVEKAWTQLAARCSGLRPDAPDEQWHAARLAAKRTRYAAEAVAPALGDAAKSFAGRIERLTEVLGEHQDAAMAAATVRSLIRSRAREPATESALDALAEVERAHVRAARDKFAAEWSQASRAKWRRWFAT